MYIAHTPPVRSLYPLHPKYHPYVTIYNSGHNRHNYSELRNNLKHYLDGVINDSEPLLVHRAGNESVVVISLDEYNSIKETEYIMKSPATMEAIRKGEEDIKNGNCVSQHEGESMSDFLNRVVCTK